MKYAAVCKQFQEQFERFCEEQQRCFVMPGTGTHTGDEEP